jgi:poly(A) polymerase
MTRIPPPPWINEPASRALLDTLAEAGIAARFVGGCVRDTLLGRPAAEIADIDIATPAPPQAVLAALDKAGIKGVPTGIAHGTVTAVVPPRHYEITTLRRDVETDGRHATVAFGVGWAEDAARRDFTINAVYLDPDGRVHDPVGGLADLAAHRVRFVGDPATRIAEDVLRVLRYYRFEARFGTNTGDAAARAACRAAIPLLPKLSAERVSRELRRLLEVSDPVPVLRMMQEDGVLPAILPEATRLDRLDRLIANKFEPASDPVLRLAAMVDADAKGMAAMAERQRLSNAWRDRLVGLARPWPLDLTADERHQRLALYRLGFERMLDLAALTGADAGRDRVRKFFELASKWKAPVFPLAGRDVIALGIPPGPRVGELLDAMRRWWEEHDFASDRAACLAQLEALAREHRSPGESRDPPRS